MVLFLFFLRILFFSLFFLFSVALCIIVVRLEVCKVLFSLLVRLFVQDYDLESLRKIKAKYNHWENDYYLYDWPWLLNHMNFCIRILVVSVEFVSSYVLLKRLFSNRLQILFLKLSPPPFLRLKLLSRNLLKVLLYVCSKVRFYDRQIVHNWS